MSQSPRDDAKSTSQTIPDHNPYTITEDMLERQLTHQNKGRYITQLYLAVVVSLAAMSFGTTFGWSSPVTSALLAEKSAISMQKKTQQHYASIVSMVPLGCAFGIIPWSYTTNSFGPQRTLNYTSIFYTISWAVLAFVKDPNVKITARFFCGFFAISYIICCESLLIDCVHRLNLLHMIVFFRSSILLGVVFTYVVGHYASSTWLTVSCTCLAVIPPLLLHYVPDSPVYLFKKSERKAAEALSWYRGQENIYMDLRKIRKDIERRKMETANTRYMIHKKVVYKPFFIIVALNFFQVFSGYYAFMYYTVNLWKGATVAFNTYIDSIIYGGCLYISNLIGMLMHYRMPFGVRRPLIVSCLLVATVLGFITIYLFIIQATVNEYTRNIVPLIMLCIYALCYETGLSTYPDIIFVDYLPYEVHVAAKTVIRIAQYFLIYVLTKHIWDINNATSPEFTFLLLTLVAYGGAIFCYFFIIESKNKSLVQIQAEMGENPVGNRGAYRSETVY